MQSGGWPYPYEHFFVQLKIVAMIWVIVTVACCQMISELHHKSMSSCYTKSPIAQVHCLTAVSVVSMKKEGIGVSFLYEKVCLHVCACTIHRLYAYKCSFRINP